MSNIDQRPYDKNGKRHGEWKIYHSNGQLWYCHSYVRDIKSGLQEGYYFDGTLRYRGHRNMGRRVGYWYFYQQKEYYLWLI